jgi:hypothetical protein
MPIRDRIAQFRRVRASELKPNPGNWRTHPPAQAEALHALLVEVGYTQALTARQLDDGSLELIDGHLRAATTPESVVPVLVLDISAREADMLLLALDPLSTMAGADRRQLQELLDRLAPGRADVEAMLGQLASEAAVAQPPGRNLERRDNITYRECFEVVVECRDEDDQRRVFERMTEAGYCCRLLTL